ncbi:lipid-A-disaccharide synthase [Chitinilyticum piscinae]|uniref:Lipid-A-disaccharide synthase n=1 Tax=Chitinilyticum piscinae TaxID=2866724 RepID=A0A8J7FKI3_9NEIS|nr:lipid-A-disaccharide synthase [Chitinilyticum piscinae]MBE9609402.1 lipid-A-disaccharide synthase [Chitinilyticum piscinae]
MVDTGFKAGRGPRIAIVAGEASGDLLGAALIESLRKHYPDAQFIGVAGPKMQSAGARTLAPMATLAVGGIVEVVKHLPALLRLRRQLIAFCRREKPDLFIGIDAPDFNLGLARTLKQSGIKTVHYVSPSVWAWRPERIKKIRAAVNHMLLILPFEPPIYAAAGIPATYVGHPLADQLPLQPDVLAQREELQLSPASKVVAILPGSRMRELEALADLMVATAQKLAEQLPELIFLVPLISRETRARFEQAIWTAGAQQLNWRLMFGHSHEAMTAADVVLQASGTAVLEAMLLKRPTVVTYRVAPTTYRMVRKKFLLPYVSLPNIISGRFLVPEFLQENATAENLSQAVLNYLQNKTLVADLQACFTAEHLRLQCSAADRAADAVRKVLQGAA